jgi:hypothetical protein
VTPPIFTAEKEELKHKWEIGRGGLPAIPVAAVMKTPFGYFIRNVETKVVVKEIRKESRRVEGLTQMLKHK